MSTSEVSSKPYDLIVFGATSFVGQILSNYLVETIGVNGEISWAIASRSESKLAILKESLGDAASQLPVLIADSHGEASLQTLCSQTRVIISTVGPYALYGELLVKACAESGTDYADLTGEAHWIGMMKDKYNQAAEASGARIVNCCGFDSIPSDMGVFAMQQRAQAQFGHPLPHAKLRVKAMKGGASGGTIASMIEALKAAKADPKMRKKMGNPYLLCGSDHQYSIRAKSVSGPQFDPDFNCWIAPFVMEAINSRVVLHSNALLDMAYGRDFSYSEGMLTGKGLKGRIGALMSTVAFGMLGVALYFSPTRALLEKFVLPAPGEGPSPEAQLKGYFDVRVHGRDDQGNQLTVKVTGDRDPGYGSTAKMLGQAGLCLALDIKKEDRAGGFLTPSVAMGDALLKRLEAHSGLAFVTCD
ncbi:saccharopine dehydrogenase NADP-binding domain-containing protein [Porticoccaceae bacterium]|nr:saccharopine dehydrogenase NADP-binding domain-containing protein [Porticoccaceae bacterium]MDC1453670.1 saccharopine dehydrogenase NADP-binding domain-containing protein [Porticoccaceae bacterium]